MMMESASLPLMSVVCVTMGLAVSSMGQCALGAKDKLEPESSSKGNLFPSR